MAASGVLRERQLDPTILGHQVRGGQSDMLAYLQAQREYVDVVRQYRDALLDLRRAALRVNTVTGIRLVYDPIDIRATASEASP